MLKKNLLTIFSTHCYHFTVNWFIYTHMNRTFRYCRALKCTGITPKVIWKLSASPLLDCSHFLMEHFHCTTSPKEELAPYSLVCHSGCSYKFRKPSLRDSQPHMVRQKCESPKVYFSQCLAVNIRGPHKF